MIKRVGTFLLLGAGTGAVLGWLQGLKAWLIHPEVLGEASFRYAYPWLEQPTDELVLKIGQTAVLTWFTLWLASQLQVTRWQEGRASLGEHFLRLCSLAWLSVAATVAVSSWDCLAELLKLQEAFQAGVAGAALVGVCFFLEAVFNHRARSYWTWIMALLCPYAILLLSGRVNTEVLYSLQGFGRDAMTSLMLVGTVILVRAQLQKRGVDWGAWLVLAGWWAFALHYSEGTLRDQLENLNLAGTLMFVDREPSFFWLILMAFTTLGLAAGLLTFILATPFRGQLVVIVVGLVASINTLPALDESDVFSSWWTHVPRTYGEEIATLPPTPEPARTIVFLQDLPALHLESFATTLPREACTPDAPLAWLQARSAWDWDPALVTEAIKRHLQTDRTLALSEYLSASAREGSWQARESMTGLLVRPAAVNVHWSEVRGRLTLNGKPLAGARVRLLSADHPENMLTSEKIEFGALVFNAERTPPVVTVTDAQGKFVFLTWPRGKSVLAVLFPGHVDVRPEIHLDPLDFQQSLDVGTVNLISR